LYSILNFYYKIVQILINKIYIFGGTDHRVHTEWRLHIFGVHPIMMKKAALAGEGGGCTPTPLSLLPSRTKLQCTLQLRGQILSLYFFSTSTCTLWSRLDPDPQDTEDVRHLDEDGLVGDADGALLLEVAGRLHKSSLLTRGIRYCMVNHWD
jgi:hypothetical protein